MTSRPAWRCLLLLLLPLLLLAAALTARVQVGLTYEITGLDDGVMYSVTMQVQQQQQQRRRRRRRRRQHSLTPLQAHNACGWNDPCRPCLMLTEDAGPSKNIPQNPQTLTKKKRYLPLPQSRAPPSAWVRSPSATAA
jgi:hypothetical protein